MQANSISFEDKRDLLEAMRILAGYDISLLELARLYTKISDELKGYNTTLQAVLDEYKKIHQERELSVKILRAVEVYINIKQKEGLARNYQTHIETTLYKFVEQFGRNTMLSDITAIQIENWLNSMKKMKLVDSPMSL